MANKSAQDLRALREEEERRRKKEQALRRVAYAIGAMGLAGGAYMTRDQWAPHLKEQGGKLLDTAQNEWAPALQEKGKGLVDWFKDRAGGSPATGSEPMTDENIIPRVAPELPPVDEKAVMDRYGVGRSTREWIRGE